MTTIPNEFRESSRRASRIEIRVDNGRSVQGSVPSTALASRDALLLSPPFFPEKIFRPAWIIGKSYDSGHDLGLEVMAEDGKSSAILERFVGKIGLGSQNRDQG
jgi:hypothetical protein